MAGGQRPGTPPAEQRCNRSDGKSWRCKNWRRERGTLCEFHYEQQVNKSRVRVSSRDGESGGGRSSRKRKKSDDKTFRPPAASVGGMFAGRDIQMRERKPVKPMVVEVFGSDEENEEDGLAKVRKRFFAVNLRSFLCFSSQNPFFLFLCVLYLFWFWRAWGDFLQCAEVFRFLSWRMI